MPADSKSVDASEDASSTHSAAAASPALKPRSLEGAVRVALLYKRHAPLDELLLNVLEKELSSRGYGPFIDRSQAVGMEWARALERQIRTADVVVPLLSAASVENEMFAFEVEIAHEAAVKQNHRPQLLPLRVSYDGPLPECLSGFDSAAPSLAWRGPADNDRVVAELLGILQILRASSSRPAQAAILRVPSIPAGGARSPSAGDSPESPADIVPLGGAVPLHSRFYMERPADAEFRSAILRKDSIILVKGARQMGKTSLLARGLDLARKQGAKVIQVDLQKLNASHLESAESFYFALAELIADGLELGVHPQKNWDSRRGANVSFERFLRREVLDKLQAPFVWGLDEVDRLFTGSFSTEVFALFRSWHNERALDPTGPWNQLVLAMAYATEAHLFIKDLNQSPFNVGTRLALDDFTRDQVSELNGRFGSPLPNFASLARFYRVVSGQPCLVCRGLHEMAAHGLSIDDLERQADQEDGVFGDHLRRLLVALAMAPDLCEAVREVLAGQVCPTLDSFYRLRSAGVLSGTSPQDAHPRCQIYGTYLARHLL